MCYGSSHNSWFSFENVYSFRRARVYTMQGEKQNERAS